MNHPKHSEYAQAAKERTHVLAYVKRSVITHWKRLMNPLTGGPFPFIYGSNDGNVFDNYVKEKSVLWVIGASPDKRPPSVVAKLEVIGRADQTPSKEFNIPKKVLQVFKDKWDYVAIGHPTNSRFYGYNNASCALMSLVFRWVHTERTLSREEPCPEGPCTWKSSYSTPLNSPAIIVNEPTLLYDLDRAAQRSVFISWKRGDNWHRRKDVRELAYALADMGLHAWLDVLAFPPSIALKTKVDPKKEIVKCLLRYGYERCHGLLALETKEYGKPGISENWTKMEWTGQFGDKKIAHPLPFHAVYRYDPSEYLQNLDENNIKCMSDLDWRDVAKIVHDEMEKRVPLD